MFRDHTYGNRNTLTANYEPKDEVCEDYVKLEPTEIARWVCVMPYLNK